MTNVDNITLKALVLYNDERYKDQMVDKYLQDFEIFTFSDLETFLKFIIALKEDNKASLPDLLICCDGGYGEFYKKAMLEVNKITNQLLWHFCKNFKESILGKIT